MPVIALGGLAVVMVSLMALLLLLGTAPVQRFLSNILSNIPIVGGYVDGWINGAINAVAGWLASIVGDIDSWIASLYYPIQVLIGFAHDGLNAVHDQLQKIVQAYVPFVLGNLWNQTWGYIQSLTSAIATTLTQAETFAYNIGLSLANSIAASLVTAETFAYDIGVSLANTISATLVTAETFAYNIGVSLADTIEREIATLTDSVIAKLLALQDWTTQSIAAAYAAVFTNLGNQVTQELGGIWDTVATEGDAAVQGIAAEYPDIASQLRNIPLTVPGDIVGALAAVGAITIPLSTYVERCGIPMCKNLSGFGNELQALLGLVGEGAMLAFIIDAIEHPEQVANDTQAIATDIISPVYDIFRSLVA